MAFTPFSKLYYVFDKNGCNKFLNNPEKQLFYVGCIDVNVCAKKVYGNSVV